MSRVAPILALCALILIIVFGEGFWSYQQGAKALREKIDGQMNQSMETVKAATEQVITEVIGDMEFWARQPVMVRILDNDPDQEIAAFLEGSRKHYPMIEEIECVSVAGKLLAWSGPVNTNATHAPPAGELQNFRNGLRATLTESGAKVTLTVPINWKFDQIELLGVLRATMSPGSFLPRNQKWWTGLATPAGRVLAQQGKQTDTILLKDGESVVPALGSVVLRHRKIDLLSGVRGPEWQIAVAEPRDVLFASIFLLRRMLIGTMAGTGLVIVTLVSVFVLRQRALVLRLASEARRLETATEKLSREINERIVAETELKQVHKQLLETSRQAGMAEVATGVLHNVGNVLNSVNVSASLVADRIKQSRAADLDRVVALLREHNDDLGAFLTADPKGRKIVDFLAQLSARINSEQSGHLEELESLHKNIDHIKDIVAMQQNYAKVAGVVDTVKVVDLVEDALRMNAGALMRHEVEVIRDCEEVPPITVEKHKVLQILVNLIRNAKYACDESGRANKRLTVRVAGTEGGVRISVIDNGVGIAPENLTRIFGLGFTTRKEGHGFGLHSGALAARELGGTLTAHSDGPGKGAAFILDLPFERK